MSADESQVSEGVVAEAAVESSSPAIESPISSDTEAAPSPEEGVSEAAAAGEDAVQEPELPEFDFDAWEGGLDDLPDMYKPVGTRMSQIHGNKVSEFESEMDQLRRLNDALMVGEEDPRVADFQSKWEESKTGYESLQKEFETYRNEVQAMHDRDAEQWAKSFQEKHSEIFENEELSTALQTLVHHDWDPEVAVKLLSLKEDSIEIALKAKADGVPDLYALRLAENASRPAAKSVPRPAAKITSGATTRSSPDQQMMDMNETSSLDDKRMIVARRALKNARR